MIIEVLESFEATKMDEVSVNKLVAINLTLTFDIKKRMKYFGKCLEMTDHKRQFHI